MSRLVLAVACCTLWSPAVALAAGAGEPLGAYVDGTTYTIQHGDERRTLSIRELLADLPGHRWDHVVVDGVETTVQVVDLKISFCHYPDVPAQDGELITVSINVLQPYLAYEADHLGNCRGATAVVPAPVTRTPVTPAPVTPAPSPPVASDEEAARRQEERDREDREARADRSDVQDREGRGDRDGRD